METEGGVQLLQLGEEVYTSDGTRLGPIKRIWWGDGRVEPPEEQSQGTLNIVSDQRRREPGKVFFQIDIAMAPDWFVPFSAVAANVGGNVTLNLTYTEAEGRPWQIEPE